MVVSEPSGETETDSVNSNKEPKDNIDPNLNEREENNQNENGNDSVSNNTKDTDSGIEVKAAINENNEAIKDESNETASKSCDNEVVVELKSPESLKALSDRAVRVNSSSSIENEAVDSNTEDKFANFDNAFSKGWFRSNNRCCSSFVVK